MKAADKSRLIKNIIPPLRERYGQVPKPPELPMLEHLIFAILSEDATEAKAEAVFQKFKEGYFDWNEVRVSSITELREVMKDLPDVDNRCARLKGTLKRIFESLYSFDIDGWRKLSHKELTRRLAKFPANSQYVVARLIRDGLKGSTIPIDNDTLRVLQRLGVAKESDKPEKIAFGLSRIVGKNRNCEFTYLVAELAADVCLPNEPKCENCPIAKLCSTGVNRLQPPEEQPKTTRRRKRKATAKDGAAKKKKKKKGEK